MSLFRARASSQKSKSLRWRFSTRASREDRWLSIWRERQGTSVSPASLAARRRRSPATSSQPRSPRRTVRGWSRPRERMEAASSSSSCWGKTRRG